MNLIATCLQFHSSIANFSTYRSTTLGDPENTRILGSDVQMSAKANHEERKRRSRRLFIDRETLPAYTFSSRKAVAFSHPREYLSEFLKID